MDFNDANPQRAFDVIPAGTVATLQMAVRPGNSGEGDLLRRSNDGNSEGLDCEFTVVEGPCQAQILEPVHSRRHDAGPRHRGRDQPDAPARNPGERTRHPAG
jgi:hypothetical protein